MVAVMAAMEAPAILSGLLLVDTQLPCSADPLDNAKHPLTFVARCFFIFLFTQATHALPLSKQSSAGPYLLQPTELPCLFFRIARATP